MKNPIEPIGKGSEISDSSTLNGKQKRSYTILILKCRIAAMKFVIV
jgi:hypothetical protein